MNAHPADINGKPTVISLFAGCGGSSLGYQMARYKELLAVEIDDNAVQTFKMNFKDVLVLQKDITKISGQEILNLCNIKKGELDVLDGSPPCQGFSTAGKRQVCDERNDLVGHYIRLVSELQPKVFIMENVSGMVKGKMKGLFIKYIKQMKELDYNVSCRLLNAKWFSVPQSRERMICIGIRKNIGNPIFPEPHDKIITIADVFKNVPKNTIPEYTNNKSACKVKAIVSKIKQGKNATSVHPKKHGFNLCRLHSHKPSPTITKMVSLKGLYAGIIHPHEDRLLTISELKRIGSFPDNFQFVGTYEQQWARIGNSVPPLMMKAIAETIKKEILEGVKPS